MLTMELKLYMLLALASVAVAEGCPSECACTGTTVDCSGQGLTQVPQDIPEYTTKLDLSSNDLMSLGDSSFPPSLSSSLRSLDLSHNAINCVEDFAFDGLKRLQFLNLRSNDLSSVPYDLYHGLELRAQFDLGENPLRCGCGLSVALDKASGSNGHGVTVCADGDGKHVDLDDWTRDNDCSDGDANPIPASVTDCPSSSSSSLSMSSSGASSGDSCPKECSCFDGIADCRNKKIDKFPKRFPREITEIRLEQNRLSEIPPRAFVGYKRLRRIDISNNEITKIAADAFNGLKSLTSLVLYGNKISFLPPTVFHGLTSMQLLLMNSNRLRCIHKDTFRDLESVSLLSLYDNRIQNLEAGSFDGMAKLQTLHLARNPFFCDCNLGWLVDWLRENPVETSGVRCDAPKKFHKRKVASMVKAQLVCSKDFSVERANGQCRDVADCPSACRCRNHTVDCSHASLTDIPRQLPKSTVKLVLSDNAIARVGADGLFNRLPRLRHLDLSRNEIHTVEEGAFEGAASLKEILLSQNVISEMNSRMLRGLVNLETLDLFSNSISCVTPGAFDGIRSLKALNMVSNSINCNCHMGWFSEWLKRKGFTKTGPRCHKPDTLKNRAIHSLEAHDFQCDDNNNLGCLGENYCPPSCTCTGTIVRCSHANLKTIPEGIPRETSELYLDVNQIKEIDTKRIEHLKSLARLDLSNNEVSVLPPFVFANLTRLSTLIVSYNKLQCVQENSFFGLSNLRILSLHGNEISRIPESAFDERASVTHLALGSNPFHCDCDLRWLSAWIKRDYIEPGIAKCFTPNRLREKLVLTTPTEEFSCEGKDNAPDSKVLAKCNLCHENPCSNGAECSALPNRDFECRCALGFYGKTCDAVIDACYGNPCANGAKCQVAEAGRFRCECPHGFSGVRCEVNIDDCEGNRCQNDAACIDGIETYSCQCKEGYTGQFCQTRIPLCPVDHNPCRNGGKCVDHGSHFTCECREGFRGDNCSENVDDCASNLCQNGATCVDGIGDYTCRCPSEFHGRFCEIEPMVAAFPQTSPCQQHDCKHGICFQPKADSRDYICKCAEGYSGKRCEYLTSLSFRHNDSYVELERLAVRPHANITLEFASTQENGVLVYTGEAQHLAVELFRGRIRVSYDVGNYPVSTMFSYEIVADGRPHRIELISVRKNFTLRVDNGLARSIVNEGKNDFLNVGTPLYIAGLPSSPREKAIKQWHLRNITSFKGCMMQVSVNNKVVDFLQAAPVRHKVSAGCSAFNNEQQQQQRTTAEASPCDRDPCKHGQCKQVGENPGYKCKCKDGYKGNHCDIRESPQKDRSSSGGGRKRGNKKRRQKCRKQKFRDYFLEPNGCRSKRPYNMSKCLGAGGAKCVGNKTKVRRIRFVCDDGRQYKKDVEIIRRCGRMHKW